MNPSEIKMVERHHPKKCVGKFYSKIFIERRVLFHCTITHNTTPHHLLATIV